MTICCMPDEYMTTAWLLPDNYLMPAIWFLDASVESNLNGYNNINRTRHSLKEFQKDHQRWLHLVFFLKRQENLLFMSLMSHDFIRTQESFRAMDFRWHILLQLVQINSTSQNLAEPVELGELEELRRKRRRGSGFAEEKKTARLVLTATASQHYSIWPNFFIGGVKTRSKMLLLYCVYFWLW